MKFSEFVETYSVNLVKFAKRADLGWATLHRFYRRTHPNLTLINAKKIVDASKKKVGFLDLVHEAEEIRREIEARKPKIEKKEEW